MADIKTSIILDDKQYTTKIKAAEKSASALGSALSQAAVQGTNAMSSLAQGADKIKSSMSSLGTTIAGVGLVAFANSALESVSNMADLAAQVGITTQSMMELQLAGLAAGKSGEEMANMMQKLNIATQNANEGSTKLQSSYLALGLTMAEVNAMTPDERFKAVVKSLANMDDASKRASLGMELLGKQGTKADFKDLQNNIEKTAGSQAENAKAAAAAKDVMDKLATTVQMVKNEFVALAAPLLSWIEPFIGGAGQAKAAAQTLAVAMGVFAAAGTVTAINSIVKAIGTLAASFLGTAETSAVATAAMVANSRAVDTFMTGATGRLGTATAALNTVLAENQAILAMGPPTAARAAIMADNLAAAQSRVAIATQAATATSAAATSTLAAVATAETAVAVEGNAAAAATTRLGTAMTGTAAAGSTLLGMLTKIAAVAALLTFSSDLNEGEDAKIEATKRIGKAMQELSEDELASYYKLTQAQQHLVTNAILAGKQAREALKIGKDATPEGEVKKDPAKGAYVDRSGVEAAKSQLESMSLANRLAKEKAQIDLESIGRSSQLNAIEKASFEAESTFLKEELRIRTEVDKLRQQAATASAGGDTVKAGVLLEQAAILEKQVEMVREQTSEMAKLQIENQKRTDAEKMILYYMDLEKKQATQVADIRRNANQLTMTQDEIMLDNINKRVDAEIDAALKIREALNGNRKFNIDEEKKIRDELREQISPTFDAERKATQDLIDKSRDFSTGWEKAWKDYASNATNAANQAKEMFNTFSQSFESMFEQLVRNGKVEWKSLLEDMVIQLMKSDVQRLFASITSGGAGASGGGFFQSIGKFFSGGFANGGSIPMGGYGIVGESGPEVVNGPATVTPIAPGVTNNIYITAMDSQDVMRALSKAPSTMIYGMAEKGRRDAGGR